ncbi:MAG: PAS domain S-box protein [Bryobacteraceae bacterium]
MDYAKNAPDKFTAMADSTLIKRSVSGACLYLLLLLMTPLVFPPLRDFSMVVLTAAPVLLLTAAARLYLRFSFSRDYDRDPGKWKRRMAFSVYSSAAAWSAFVCGTISSYDLDWPTWFILLVTSGIASSATVALNPDLRLLRRYLSILILPFLLWGLTRGTAQWVAVAGVLAVQYLYLWVQAGNSSRSYWQAFQNREELRVAKGNYAALVNSIDGIVWEADPNTFTFTFVSQRAERILGYSLDLWLNDANFWTKHIHPHDRDWVIASCRQAIAGQRDHVLEYRMVAEDGGVVWLRDSIAVVTQDGQTAKLCGVMLDITEHKRAEEQQALLSSAIEQVQESVVITGPDAAILYVNPAFERVTGYRRDEVLGQNPRVLKSGQHPTGFYEQMWSTLSGGETWTGHFVNRRKDGSRFEEEAVISPVRDAAGRLTNYVAVKHDVTERQRVARDLKVLAHALRSIREAVAITDTNGVVTFVNDAFVRTYGFAPAEIIGMSVDALSALRAPSHDAQEIIAASLAGGWQGEVWNRRKDGAEFPVFLSTSAIRDEQGKATALVGVITDITEQKKTEGELRRAKEAAEAGNRSKSEFLANMSHEIRTPLNGIIGMTDLALDTRLTLEQHEYLSTVKTSADSLLTVVNDILDFSKIEAGHLDLDVTQYSLRSLVYQTIQPLAFRAQQKGIGLTHEIDAAVPDSLLGDAGRLKQVLVNLLGNAIKFTGKGSVTLSVEPAFVLNDQARLHFVVTDSGIGIPKEKHRTIFDSFAQADSSTTRKYGGTGLGLSISARLVELMGGRIWVESEPGKGSSFHFTVQLGRPAPAAVDHSPDSLRDVSVLLVDPDPVSSRILERTLAAWGARPTTASGVEDISLLLEESKRTGDPFRAVVVTDSLPKVDGLAVAQEICGSLGDPGVSPVIIIILGSARDSSDWKHPLVRPCFLTKPIRPPQLKESILLGLSRHRSARLPSAPPPPSIGRKRAMRILVAEDNPVNTLLVKRLLEKQGHSLVTARNGCEALHSFESEPFDLILMDVQMPEMDGLDATVAIRASERSGGPIPIVAMTAHAMKGDRERCLQAGMDDYLTKPIQAAELVRVIDRIAMSRRGNPAGMQESLPNWEASLEDNTAVDLVELHNVVAVR